MANESLKQLLGEVSDTTLMLWADKAQTITRQHFGHNIDLYTPIYLSNYCANRCSYCSFRSDNPLARTKLSPNELEHEIELIKAKGIDHVLMVTGEHPKQANITHFLNWLSLLKNHFHSVSLESQQLDEADYRRLTAAGLDGVYLYQETYDRQTYEQVHLSGYKRDYDRRIQAPLHMAKAGVRRIGMGVLLGLRSDWKSDVKALLQHVRRLRQHSRTSDISISLPRLRESKVFTSEHEAARALLQIIIAVRLYEPRVGIALSTREPAWIRDLLLPYGVTSASVASKTAPGGHQASDQLEQFAISDKRSVDQFCEALSKLKLMPVYKNWHAGIS